MNRSPSDNSASASLAAAHSTINQRHLQMRMRLLDCLPDDMSSRAQPRRRAMAWCYLAGGLGLVAVVAAVALTTWILAPASPASAMERLAKALDQVATYSYRLESVSVSTKGDGRTVRQVTTGRWRSDPVGLYAVMNIFERLGTNTPTPSEPKALVELEEAHQAGRRGILVDHLKKEYWWIDEELDAAKIGNPLVAIYMVRQKRGRILRSLGTKEISGRTANGFEIKLGDQPAHELGPVFAEGERGVKDARDAEIRQSKAWEWQDVDVEVWIDPTTDLPIEFHFIRRGEDFETTYRFSELKWNVELPSNAFDVTRPGEYTELAAPPYSE